MVITLSGGGGGCVRLLVNCDDSKQEGCGEGKWALMLTARKERLF